MPLHALLPFIRPMWILVIRNERLPRRIIIHRLSASFSERLKGDFYLTLTPREGMLVYLR